MGAYEYLLPFLEITNADATVYGEVESVPIAGTNNDRVVGTVWWTNATSGASGAATRDGGLARDRHARLWREPRHGPRDGRQRRVRRRQRDPHPLARPRDGRGTPTTRPPTAAASGRTPTGSARPPTSRTRWTPRGTRIRCSSATGCTRPPPARAGLLTHKPCLHHERDSGVQDRPPGSDAHRRAAGSGGHGRLRRRCCPLRLSHQRGQPGRLHACRPTGIPARLGPISIGQAKARHSRAVVSCPIAQSSGIPASGMAAACCATMEARLQTARWWPIPPTSAVACCATAAGEPRELPHPQQFRRIGRRWRPVLARGEHREFRHLWQHLRQQRRRRWRHFRGSRSELHNCEQFGRLRRRGVLY